MEINIPGPTNPAYFAKIRFSLVNRSLRLRDDGKGRALFDTEVGVESEPRGRPVWNTFVMLMWRGDMAKKGFAPSCPSSQVGSRWHDLEIEENCPFRWDLIAIKVPAFHMPQPGKLKRVAA
jgi:hypothetical protein